MNSSTEFIVHSPETYARAREEKQQRRRQSSVTTSPVKLEPMPALARSQESLARRRSHSEVPVSTTQNDATPRRKSDGDASVVDINSSVASVASVASVSSFASVASSTPSRSHSPATRENSSFEIVESTGRERARKRRRTTPSELEVLESEFVQNNKPCKEHRERIAERLGMEEKCVQIWFQNKRQSCRRQLSQADSSAGDVSQDTSSASLRGSIRGAFRTHSFPASAFTTVRLLPENADTKPGQSELGPTPILPPPTPAAATTTTTTTTTTHTLPAIHRHHKHHSHHQQRQSPVVVRPDDAEPVPAPTTTTTTTTTTSAPAATTAEPKNNENANKGKSIRLTMSADGKAEVVVRSPLKPLYSQQQQQRVPFHAAFAGAKRFASMPLLQPSRGEADAECARNLLLLRTGGQW